MERAESGTPEPQWDHQGIIAEIRRRGSTLAHLARENGIKRGTLQTVFHRRYPRGQRIIAEFLGRGLHELWPQHYGPDDRPLTLRVRAEQAKKNAA